MARSEPTPADLGPLLVSTAHLALARMRRDLADDDAKVASRAYAEFTKLLNVCAKHGIPMTESPPAPVPAPQPTPERAAPEVPPPEPEPVQNLHPPKPAERPRSPVNTLPLQIGRSVNEPRSQSVLHTVPPVAESVGPPQLTSFLGPAKRVTALPSTRAPATG